jgi:molybdopterin synthase catalytic subunit
MRSIVSRAKNCPPDSWPPQPASRADKDAIKASLKDVILSPDFPSSSSSDPSSPSNTDESLSRPTNPLSIVRVALIHRIGPVDLKESSILIAVSSPHRRRAFEVAEWILEETKKEVPVWKREVRVRADEGEEEGTEDMAAGGGREIREDGEGWVGLREAERRGEDKTGGYQVS